MYVLITRPEDVALSLSQRLESLGHQTLIDPLIKIIPTTSKIPPLSSIRSVVTTSQQAIRCLADVTRTRDFPLWCIGGASTKVAKNLGFKNIHTAGGSFESLISALGEDITSNTSLPILHVSGDVIRGDVVKACQEKGIAAQRIVLYQTEEAATFSPETHQAMLSGVLDAVLFYSPRTARVFGQLCHAAQLESACANVMAVCLSKPITQEICHLPWKNIRIAKQTTTEDLLKALDGEEG